MCLFEMVVFEVDASPKLNVRNLHSNKKKLSDAYTKRCWSDLSEGEREGRKSRRKTLRLQCSSKKVSA